MFNDNDYGSYNLSDHPFMLGMLFGAASTAMIFLKDSLLETIQQPIKLPQNELVEARMAQKETAAKESDREESSQQESEEEESEQEESEEEESNHEESDQEMWRSEQDAESVLSEYSDNKDICSKALCRRMLNAYEQAQQELDEGQESGNASESDNDSAWNDDDDPYAHKALVRKRFKFFPTYGSPT